MDVQVGLKVMGRNLIVHFLGYARGFRQTYSGSSIVLDFLFSINFYQNFRTKVIYLYKLMKILVYYVEFIVGILRCIAWEKAGFRTLVNNILF